MAADPDYTGPITRDGKGRPHCTLRNAMGDQIVLDITAERIEGRVVPGTVVPLIDGDGQ